MSSNSNVLSIAEIPYESGVLHFRYARYLSVDGAKWVRHGLFQAYHENGKIASEGTYEHGEEHGLWRDYHESGQLAAEGYYEHGREVAIWKSWRSDGGEEMSEDHGR